jgi:deazaflavin-dependent oxidoreductase (nitroreductase family)
VELFEGDARVVLHLVQLDLRRVHAVQRHPAHVLRIQRLVRSAERGTPREAEVVANLGAPDHPAWYHNLLAHPVVRVEVGTEVFEAIAVPTEGARRDHLFDIVVRAVPGYGDYQARTSRILPVVALERPGVGEGPREVTNLADKLLEIHVWLRSQLRHIRSETDAYFAAHSVNGDSGEARQPSLGLQIRQHCLAFCQALEFHHTSEDAHLFPGIATHHPHLGGVFSRLRDEHVTVTGIQNELVALLADITTADPERFRAELDRMSKELTAHLDYEEEHLLPVLADVPWPPTP